MNLVTSIYKEESNSNKDGKFTDDMEREEKIEMLEKELSVSTFGFISADVKDVSEKCRE